VSHLDLNPKIFTPISLFALHQITNSSYLPSSPRQSGLRETEELIFYVLTSYSRVLLEELTGFQLVKKVPTFYGTWSFITTVTRARHLSLSWASSIQSIPPHPSSWRSILILSSHLCLDSEVVSFPQISPETLYKTLPSPYSLHVPLISFFSILSPQQYWVSSTNH